MGSQIPALRSMGCPFGQVVGFVSFLKPSWTSENAFSNPKLGVDFPLMGSHTVHKHSRNLSQQYHSLYKSHPPALAEPFLCCFWASAIGRDIIWYIFGHILKHSSVSSGNKRRNDNEGTISRSTSKGFFSLSVTDAPTLSARKDGESQTFLGFLQLFWRAFVPPTRNAASSRIRVLLLLEKEICRTRKRKGDGTEKGFAGKMFA